MHHCNGKGTLSSDGQRKWWRLRGITIPVCCPAQYSRFFSTDCICAEGITGPIPGILIPLPNSADVESSAPDTDASSLDLILPVEKIITLRLTLVLHGYWLVHWSYIICPVNGMNLQAQEISFSIKLKFITFRLEWPCYELVLSQMNPINILSLFPSHILLFFCLDIPGDLCMKFSIHSFVYFKFAPYAFCAPFNAC